MNQTKKLPINHPAPGFTLPDVFGRPHTLEAFRGRVVVLNFWSAECPWSLRADESLTTYMQTWGEAVAWISVAPNANEPPELLKEVSKARGLPLVLLDRDRALTVRYGAEMTPHVFVVDSEGVLRYQGAFDDVTFRQPEPTRSYVQEAVEAVLSGAEPDPGSTDAYGCTIVYFADG